MIKQYLQYLLKSLIICLCCVIINGAPNVPVCALESSCAKNVTETSAVCELDEESNCIRKYPSVCHLKIISCLQNRVIRDYSDVYCMMETYLCEELPSYERWTIFYYDAKD